MPYDLIYSLELLVLKTLKTYIKANLASIFIKLFVLYYYSNTICVKKRW